MKSIITVVVLLPCLNCFGQKEVLIDKNGIYSYWGRAEKYESKKDTTPVLMLVFNNELKVLPKEYWAKGRYAWFDSTAYVIYGYAVREAIEVQDGTFETVIRYHTVYNIIEYLDADKKPLSKNIIVWMAK